MVEGGGHASAGSVSQAELRPDLLEEPRGEPAAEDLGHHVDGGVIRVVVAEAQLAHEDEGLFDVVLLDLVDRVGGGGDLGKGDLRLRALVGPSAEIVFQPGLHVRDGEIPPHGHVSHVWPEPVFMEGEQVVPLEVVQVGVFELPGVGGILAVEDLVEFSGDHPERLVVPSGDLRPHLRFRQVDLVLGERRVLKEVREKLQDFVGVLFQAFRLKSDLRVGRVAVYRSPDAVQVLVGVVAVHVLRPAGPEGHSEKLGKAVLVLRFDDLSALEHCDHADGREIVVLDQQDGDAVDKLVLDHLGRRYVVQFWISELVYRALLRLGHHNQAR